MAGKGGEGKKGLQITVELGPPELCYAIEKTKAAFHPSSLIPHQLC